MSHRANPDLLLDVKRYGHVDIEACFNCGNCTAICPLSSDENPFPRDMVRYLQVGAEDQLLASTDPWLCYYCGECTTTCPRAADPAETMMTLRRWLTAQYDSSGHSAKLYTSTQAAWRAIVRYSLVPLVLLLVCHFLSSRGVNAFQSFEVVTDRVQLNAFAPVMWVWAFVLVDFAILAFRLFSNVGRMWRLNMDTGPDRAPIPLQAYLTELRTLAVHTATQKRWRDCGGDHSRWLKHLLLVSGYAIMLVLVVGLLFWFQTDNLYPLYHPQRWLGYYATVVLLFASGEALLGRYRRGEELHRFSHHTDWLFPAFLFVGSLTGILVHGFRYMGWPWPTYLMYVFHLMCMVAMLDTEVGIGKWTHLFYRPLALYFAAVKEKAAELQESESGSEPVRA